MKIDKSKKRCSGLMQNNIIQYRWFLLSIKRKETKNAPQFR